MSARLQDLQLIRNITAGFGKGGDAGIQLCELGVFELIASISAMRRCSQVPLHSALRVIHHIAQDRKAVVIAGNISKTAGLSRPSRGLAQ
jgi:hypothetical protein